MTKIEYWQSLTAPQRTAIAEAAGTNYDYFYQICTDRRRVSVQLALALEKATRRRLTRRMLLPELYALLR